MKNLFNLNKAADERITKEFLKEYVALCERYDRTILSIAQQQIVKMPPKNNVNNPNLNPLNPDSGK